MVALKPEIYGVYSRQDPAGSRNAVVALKPTSPYQETVTPTMKQERRGGIETRSYAYARSDLDTRSRNAVVALKPCFLSLDSPGCRGKQERRGGIETRGVGEMGPGCRIEAGTPWWH